MNTSPACKARVARLQSEMSARGIAWLVTTSPSTQTYLCGFRALLYSRPILLTVSEQRTSLIVPALEEEHAKSHALVDELLVYREHPFGTAPTSPNPLLDSLIDDLPKAATIGIEADTCSYALAEDLRKRRSVADAAPIIRKMREVKDEIEIAAITAAAALVRHGVEASLTSCTVGASELEVDAAGTSAIHQRASELHEGSTVEHLVMTPSGVERSIMPHVFSAVRALAPGDILIHTRQLALDGYRAELERTAVVGDPSPRQVEVFRLMTAAQDAAIAALGPGVQARTVDSAARSIFDDADLGRYVITRSGHGIGLEAHERPYLRFDSDETLRAGMVVTIEPGVYIPGVGGFRHSDTLLVTEDGSRPLTEYPRNLEALIMPAGR